MADNGPPNAPGAILVADASAKLDPGQDPFGIGLIFHIDVTAAPPPQVYSAPTDGTGHASLTANIPYIPAIAGLKVLLQGVWYAGACQSGSLGYATTNGLELTILP